MARQVRTKVNQNDLRRLMKERRNNLKPYQRKIDSPLAKYNNTGQLFCIPCNVLIKTEAVWPKHILSKSHKESIAKKTKRKNTETDNEVCYSGNKKVAWNLDNDCDFGDKVEIHRLGKKQEKHHARIGFLIQGYSSSSEDDDCEDNLTSLKQQIVKTSAAVLPSDFFDTSQKCQVSSTSKSSSSKDDQPTVLSTEKMEKGKSSVNTAEAIPEGFFDDPVLDAKARKVEYKDPVEEEWEKFKKTIAEESNLSQTIMEEDAEESKAERDIHQIEQQIHNWGRVNALQSKKEELCQQIPIKKQSAEDDVNADNPELIHYLDWRTKQF